MKIDFKIYYLNIRRFLFSGSVFFDIVICHSIHLFFSFIIGLSVHELLDGLCFEVAHFFDEDLKTLFVDFSTVVYIVGHEL